MPKVLQRLRLRRKWLLIVSLFPPPEKSESIVTFIAYHGGDIRIHDAEVVFVNNGLIDGDKDGVVDQIVWIADEVPESDGKVEEFHQLLHPTIRDLRSMPSNRLGACLAIPNWKSYPC